jgi:hypothetical protein
MGQNRRFEERCPNGRYLIRKRPLRMAPMNGRFWPRLCENGLRVLYAQFSLDSEKSSFNQIKNLSDHTF